MRTQQNTYRLFASVAVFLGLTLAISAGVKAQGSIFGELRNADISTPPDSAIHFIGFIDNTDNELRLQSCIGAGFDSGYWYDDFQNFLDEAPGLEYHYFFFNQLNAQAAVLNSVIPNHGYLQEDIVLAPTIYPPSATDLSARIEAEGQVRLEWLAAADVSWHVYRRISSSSGSFFRVDNPAGDRSDPGVTQPVFVDANVTDGECFHYILVTESTAENYSPASDIIQVDLSSCCQGQVGDVNGIGGDEPTIGDVALLIDHLFISNTVPACLEETDINQSGGTDPTPENISIGDVAWLIDHLYISFIPLLPCLNLTW